METKRRVNLLSTVNIGRLQRIGGREEGRERERERERGRERCRFIARLTAYSKAITTYFSFLVLPSPKIRLST